jgi:hypothetical protein
MTTQGEDIFGQIDALLGKRSTAVLAEKTPSGDDFPLLTDVIVNSGEAESSDKVLSPSESSTDVAELQRQYPVTEDANPSSDISDNSPGFSDRILLAELEMRLLEMFRLQQESLEESFRKIIREEIRRLDGN